jgi:dolichyl-phosphate beta-glucosyltransferase
MTNANLIPFTCALVVPCYNEAARLDVAKFLEFAEATPECSLIFVNDGSRDATLAVLEDMRRRAPDSVHVLDQQPNRGKGEAVRAGLLYALDRFDAPVVGFWDADLAAPLQEFRAMHCILQQRPGMEIVFGARVKLLGRSIERNPTRHYLGRTFATVVSNLLALPVYDTQCGAKLFRRTPELRRSLELPFLSRWVFDVEIIARLIRMRGAATVRRIICEQPLQAWHDIRGSKVRPTDFMKAFVDVVRICRTYLW